MIEGHSKPLVNMLVSGFTYAIPAYQRNYDWKKDNCERLFDDLIELANSNRQGHFFGSVVSVETYGFYTKRLIIDGQQRVTTVSLLLLALWTLIKKNKIEDIGGLLVDSIRRCLIDSDGSNSLKLKLKPIKDDLQVYEQLFRDPDNANPNSNLTINFRYFLSRIQKNEIAADKLLHAISQLIIIDVALRQEDDPQLVFESLNSTGVALTEGDKIRNFILMGLSPQEQDSIYEEYWKPIEGLTRDISSFIRDYLSVKTKVISPQNKVYESFKVYRRKIGGSAEAMLSNMLIYAQLYHTLLVGKTESESLNDCIFRLNWLETSITRPFLLEVLMLHKDRVINLEEVTRIFLTVESYLYRRQICEIPTNALNKIFLTLHKEILKFDGTDVDYLQKFFYVIRNKKDSGVFPDDAQFAEAFKTRNVYKMNTRIRTYTLERLENFGTRETKEIYRRIEDGSYTIEHIMPQVLTPAWIELLGDDVDLVHETWLHRAANLTLTAYNSKYSNLSFEEKLRMPNGFRDSGIRLNHWVAQQDAWGVTQLEERSNMLAKRATELWAVPESSYVPSEKSRNTLTLDDDISFRGVQVSGFQFKGVEQSVTSWADLAEKVLRLLHAMDYSILARLAAVRDAEIRFSQYFSVDGQGFRDSVELDNGIFFERHMNTDMKISILRELFSQYGLSHDDLVFILRDDEESTFSESINQWRQMRKDYWTFALPIMRAANRNSGLFSGWNPGVDNWCNGFVGIGGTHITCIANYNGARVELQSWGGNKYTAKEMYDYVYAHRAEIEAKLSGAQISWNRGNDIKSSRLFIKDASLSITKEADWAAMANFHAKWSSKLFEVVVPYAMDFIKLCDAQ